MRGKNLEAMAFGEKEKKGIRLKKGLDIWNIIYVQLQTVQQKFRDTFEDQADVVNHHSEEQHLPGARISSI